MHYRIAKPNEFTFKRDSDGRETIEHQGVIVATTGGPYAFTNRSGDIDNDRIARVMHIAEDAGFWRMSRPRPSCPTIGVTVEVAP